MGWLRRFRTETVSKQSQAQQNRENGRKGTEQMMKKNKTIIERKFA